MSDTKHDAGGASERVSDGALETPPDVEELSLAAGFPVVTEQAWAELVAGVLKKSGAIPADASAQAALDALTSRTVDGIELRPLYTKCATRDADSGYPGVFPYTRGARARGGHDAGWDVRAWHADPDVARTRQDLLTDLENGATSVWLQAGPGAIPVEGLDEVLADVFLDSAAVVLDAGADSGAAAAALLAVAADRDVAPGSLRGALGIDPIGRQARSGERAEFGDAIAWSRRALAELPGIRPIVIDGQPYHEAGGSHAQELAYTLAAGVATLRELERAGIAPDEAAGLLEFRLTMTDEQFLSIAKLRAARLLWARIADLSGIRGNAAAQRQHAVSSWAMTTRRDPWVNILRGTLACFAGGVGGAEAVTVLPFDVAVGLPDTPARRLARNTQSILLAETHLARVIDPGGGSWYLEQLTRDLAREAWDRAGAVDAAGGMSAALAGGLVADDLAKTRAERDRAYATRQAVLTGVSEFPFLGEAPLERRPYPSAVRSGGLPRHRYAESYEALRDRAEVYAGRAGHAPTLFVAALGSPREHAARLGFLRGALSPGGIEVDVQVTTDPADLADRFSAAPAAVAAIAGTDKAYAEDGPAVAQALRDAGARRLLVAGKPGVEPPFAADQWIYRGCDLVAALTELHDVLEASA